MPRFSILVLTCLKRYWKRMFKVFLNSFKIYKKFQGFCKAQNRSKTVFKYLINRNKNRIKTVSETLAHRVNSFSEGKTSTVGHNFVSWPPCTIFCSKVSWAWLWSAAAILSLSKFPSLSINARLLKQHTIFGKACLNSGILIAYTTGLINELERYINKVSSKMWSCMLYPKELIKL